MNFLSYDQLSFTDDNLTDGYQTEDTIYGGGSDYLTDCEDGGYLTDDTLLQIGGALTEAEQAKKAEEAKKAEAKKEEVKKINITLNCIYLLLETNQNNETIKTGLDELKQELERELKKIAPGAAAEGNTAPRTTAKAPAPRAEGATAKAPAPEQKEAAAKEEPEEAKLKDIAAKLKNNQFIIHRVINDQNKPEDTDLLTDDEINTILNIDN